MKDLLIQILSFLSLLLVLWVHTPVFAGISQADQTQKSTNQQTGDEFEPFDQGSQPDEFEAFDEETGTDEFEAFNQEAGTDETRPLKQEAGADEFEAFDQGDGADEFSSFEETSEEKCENTGEGCKKKNTQLWWVLASLGLTLITGIMVRFSFTRNLRGLILMASMVVFGFYIGGCPCPIMSLQHVIFGVAGIETNYRGMIWFLGLIPVTYLAGKVWCGWVCHLGALQEFLFLPGKIRVLQSEKAQIVMRWIRIFLLIALVIQILITKTNLFKTIDPFKVAFNLTSGNLTGWILLGMLLVTSFFMYRPFCKAVCPIGLILGWVAKIPGASILAPTTGCSGCNICDSSCSINAITRDNKISKIDNQECIGCGNCVGDCKKGSMGFVRNNSSNRSREYCSSMLLSDAGDHSKAVSEKH